MRKLMLYADSMHVSLDIDQQRCNIKLAGRSDDIFRMAEMVASELRSTENEANERKEEELVARAVQWMYEDENNEWVNFHPFINKVGIRCVIYCFMSDIELGVLNSLWQCIVNMVEMVTREIKQFHL